MNSQLFEHYRRELQHVREMGGEFAAEFPKVAGRLGLETMECSDPYVERLLEGFAFLTARVQLSIESSHGLLARHLLEMVYPNHLSPTPSMVLAEFFPSLAEGSLVQGFTLERGTRLRSQLAPDERTECDFRTAHDLTLWPIEIDGVRYLNNTAAIHAAGVNVPRRVRSALQITLRTVDGLCFSELSMSELPIFLSGPDNVGAQLYEQIFRHTEAVVIACEGQELRSPARQLALKKVGFDDAQALLPVVTRCFQGYRLLQEYFCFPERYQFFSISGLDSRLHRCTAKQVELLLLFSNSDDNVGRRYRKENLRLHCVPAINLFPKTVDRIHLDSNQHRYHVIGDRTRPMDFEIHSVNGVNGYGSSRSESQRFYPYYSISEKRRTASTFYSVHREPRLLSSKQKRRGARASYVGSELFVSLVDANEAPFQSNLRQLSVDTLCTNRDLPLQMSVGKGDTDFSLDVGAPVDRIRCLAGPTIPRPAHTHHRDAWRLVSNLNLNYLSIADADGSDGTAAAAMLRQMLELYVDEYSDADRRQLEGIISVVTRPAVRQRSYRGHLEIAHGLEIRLRLDESAFEGSGVYVLGSVMERFFARYASINSFTQTVLETLQRNEIERWSVRLGLRQAI